MSSAARVAFATAADDGVALGDPTGLHVVLAPDSVEYRSGGGEVLHRFGWAQVADLSHDAPSSRARRPGSFAVLTAAVAEAVGLDGMLTTAPVTVRVTRADEGPAGGDAAEGAGGSVELPCEGFIGRGYYGPHVRALDAAIHVLRAHATTRGVLAAPARLLGDLVEVADQPVAEARERLARGWGGHCQCA